MLTCLCSDSTCDDVQHLPCRRVRSGASSPDCIKDGQECLIISPGHSLAQQCDPRLGILHLQGCNDMLAVVLDWVERNTSRWVEHDVEHRTHIVLHSRTAVEPTSAARLPGMLASLQMPQQCTDMRTSNEINACCPQLSSSMISLLTEALT